MTDALDTERGPLPDDAEVMTGHGLCTVKWVREHDLPYWQDTAARARAMVNKYRELIGLPVPTPDDSTLAALKRSEEVREDLVRAAQKVSSLAGQIYVSGLSDGEATALRAAFDDLDAALSREKAQP